MNWSHAGGRVKAEAKPLGFAAWKAGMTHIHMIDARPNSPTQNKIVWRPVTVLDSPPLLVVGYRLYKSVIGGLAAAGEVWHDAIPKELELNRRTFAAKKKLEVKEDMSIVAPEGAVKIHDVRLIVATQPKKSGMAKKKPDVVELGIGSADIAKKIEYARAMLGKELTAADALKAGEWLDATAVTKGYGFTGPVTRFGIRIQGRKDKQMNRHPGSIGSTVPRKINWRVPFAGQYGFFTRTEFNKKLLMIGEDGSKVNPSGGFVGYGVVPKAFLVVEGSVPGPAKRLVVLRKAVRPQRKEVPIDIKYISLSSKQSG